VSGTDQLARWHRRFAAAAIEALQVVRAAYLYFADLIDSQFHTPTSNASLFRQLPNQQ
jgi:hypothetical protein